MKAYVLLNVDFDMGSVVRKELEEVNEVTNIYGLYGIYDLMVEIDADSVAKVKDVVFTNIRRLNYVKNSITLLTYGDSIQNE